MIKLANAPVSFGVFELGAMEGAILPDGPELARLVHEAGYQGIDTGPIGLFGYGQELRDLLTANELSLAGGWIDLPYGDDEKFAAAQPVLDDALRVFVDSLPLDPEMPPKPTLACSSGPERLANPGGGLEFELTDAQWEIYAANVQRAVDKVRSKGLEPTFHHHASTYVETPREIDQLLARTDVGLCLDTGHLLLGGGDPIEALSRWGDRINHVHLKDFNPEVIAAITKGGGDLRMLWAGKAFVPLGTGALDLDGFMSALLATGYEGWLEVEQDAVPGPGVGPEVAFEAQKANREALRKWFA